MACLRCIRSVCDYPDHADAHWSDIWPEVLQQGGPECDPTLEEEDRDERREE